MITFNQQRHYSPLANSQPGRLSKEMEPFLSAKRQRKRRRGARNAMVQSPDGLDVAAGYVDGKQDSRALIGGRDGRDGRGESAAAGVVPESGLSTPPHAITAAVPAQHSTCCCYSSLFPRYDLHVFPYARLYMLDILLNPHLTLRRCSALRLFFLLFDRSPILQSGPDISPRSVYDSRPSSSRCSLGGHSTPLLSLSSPLVLPRCRSRASNGEHRPAFAISPSLVCPLRFVLLAGSDSAPPTSTTLTRALEHAVR